MAILEEFLKLLGIRTTQPSAPLTRSSVPSETLTPKRRVVLLPREFEKRLDNLALIEDEINGILMYKSQEGQYEQYCPVLHLYVTGMGTPSHVQADEQRMAVVNEFFQRHLEYGAVKFHTHSKGTITRFGQHYATNFSLGDIDSYKEQIVHDPEFIGMVTTPSAKLLCGKDNPLLRIINSDVQIIENKIAEELEAIAREKGFRFEAYQSRR